MKYADLDGNAVIYVPEKSEAWQFGLGKWTRVSFAEVGHKAHILSKDEFESIFNDLPPLPTGAFA